MAGSLCFVLMLFFFFTQDKFQQFYNQIFKQAAQILIITNMSPVIFFLCEGGLFYKKNKSNLVRLGLFLFWLWYQKRSQESFFHTIIIWKFEILASLQP